MRHPTDALTRLSSLYLCLLCGLTLSCSSDAGAPFDLSDEAKQALDLMPPDADFIAMVNPTDMREIDAIDPFGLFAIPDYILDENATRRPPFAFLYALGLNPEQDFSQIFVSHSAADESDHLSILAYPNATPDSLRRQMKANLDSALDSLSYNDQIVYTALNSVAPGHLAFVSTSSVVAAAPNNLIEDMIDRYRHQQVGLESNETAYALVGQASQGRSAWFVLRDVHEADINLPIDEPLASSFEALTSALFDVVIAITAKSGTMEVDIFLYPFTESVTEPFADLISDFLDNMRASQKLSEEEIEVLAGARVLLEQRAVRVNLKADTHLFQLSD